MSRLFESAPLDSTRLLIASESYYFKISKELLITIISTQYNM